MRERAIRARRVLDAVSAAYFRAIVAGSVKKHMIPLAEVLVELEDHVIEAIDGGM